MIHHNVAKLFKKYSIHMHHTMRPALHEVFVSRCIRPVNYILSCVPRVNELLSTRKRLVYVFCYTIVLPSFLVCDVSVSLLFSISACLHSLTRHDI
jgi:hypothetical protein